MASLPPKPISSPPPPQTKDSDERRHHTDERSSRYLSQDDRSYVPTRSRPTPVRVDSYVATYERKREEGRYIDRHRDRDRDGRNWNSRDRGQRGRDDDRDRYDRERFDRRRGDSYIDRYDTRRTHRGPSPRRLDRVYRSRSPHSRRPYSPSSRYPPRIRLSRSPPPPKLRYNVTSPPRSPRSPRHRSPEKGSPQFRRSRSPSKTSDYRRQERPADRLEFSASRQSSSPNKQQPLKSKSRSPSLVTAHQTKSMTTIRDTSPSLKRESSSPEMQKESGRVMSSSKYQEQRNSPTELPKAQDMSTHDKRAQDVLITGDQRLPRQMLDPNNYIHCSPREETRGSQDMDTKMLERSPPSPRQPRHPGGLLTHDGAYARRSSRSPPRGPRNHPRSFLVQTTTGSPALPPNIRGGRRQPGTPSGPRINSSHGTHDTPILATESYMKGVRNERPSVTAAVDTEIARLESHRAHLAAEYIQLERGARRALHELDVATLDLRAAEARRKVADSHLEKARVGMLGVDAAPVESPAA
ncbi:hypothetical protein AX17_003444 [Amanita inopinata Kibby_2008]|nr:hypothetical protein AX17_003444 [Amanita inopinata Kibby_2008]